MFFNENKRKPLHNNRVKFPEDLVGAPTWPPFLCLGAPTWRSWRHVKTENSLIAPNVTAAMLVERTTANKSFGNLILLLCKTWAAFFYCFGTNVAVLSRECNQRIVRTRSYLDRINIYLHWNNRNSNCLSKEGQMITWQFHLTAFNHKILSCNRTIFEPREPL